MLYLYGMEGTGRGNVGEVLMGWRAARMWTQRDLAREAGVSPTTISGIESGRISRPHFGTIRKLASALGVDPQEVLGGQARRREEEAAPLSLEWANSARDEDFEETVESATLGQLQDLSRVLDGEHARLQKLYGESPLGSRERRIIKAQIREVAAQSGSVRTSAMFHRDASAEEPERAG
jgi:transcriptional regulator with XRE-family HTH domain